MLSMSETLNDDAPPDDFGLHWDAETVELCHNLLQLYNTLPDEGGVLDQDWFLMNDIARWGAKVIEIRREVQPQQSTSDYDRFVAEWRQS